MKEKIGDVCASIPSTNGGKNLYYKIGTAFMDEGRISLKIDTIPIASSGWAGWCNVFPDKFQQDRPRDDHARLAEKHPGLLREDPSRDDIPF